MSSRRTTSTYSMWSLFRNCRKACEYRYEIGLTARAKDPNLSFGSLIHDCLQLWHGSRDLGPVMAMLDSVCAARSGDDDVRRDWHLARAMMTGYAGRYPQEEFTVVALEKTFEGPIINPATGAAPAVSSSRARSTGSCASAMTTTSWNIRPPPPSTPITWSGSGPTSRSPSTPSTPRLAGHPDHRRHLQRPRQGTPPAEQRRDRRRIPGAARELLEKSKTGKTTAKRKIPESDDDYQARLAAKYADIEMFHRETLYLSRDRFEILRAELWELTQAFLDARRRGVFYQNTSFCFNYHRPCAYFPVCRSNGNPNVIENFYTITPPHEELRATGNRTRILKGQRCLFPTAKRRPRTA